MINEQRERIERIFDRELGVADIAPQELDRMCRTIRRVVQRDCNTPVRALYVVGSFARGAAMDSVSDIDVRVVTADSVPPDRRARCERALKNTHGPHIVPTVCGYLDAHITTTAPNPNTPHIRIDHPTTEISHARCR